MNRDQPDIRAATVPAPIRGLAWLGLGAGLMYYFDPDGGRRRRALIRDQLIHLVHVLDEAIGVTVRDLGNRLEGLKAEATKLPRRLAGEEVSDRVLVERVRAALGRVVSHPHAIGVSAYDGRVVLRGPILADEVDRLLATVSSISGVRAVERHLDVHQEAGDVSALQGGRPRTGPRPEFLQAQWSPTARLLAGTLGTGLVFGGARRGGLSGLVLGAAGAALLARGVANIPLPRLLGLAADEIETDPRWRAGRGGGGDGRASGAARRQPSSADTSIEAARGPMRPDVAAAQEQPSSHSGGQS